MATASVSVLLAAALTWSSARKLSHRPEVVASYAQAGVPEGWLSTLAALLLTASAALVVGLAWPPLGIATAAALVAYFTCAVAFHVRTRDWAQITTPVAMLALAAAAGGLHLAALD